MRRVQYLKHSTWSFSPSAFWENWSAYKYDKIVFSKSCFLSKCSAVIRFLADRILINFITWGSGISKASICDIWGRKLATMPLNKPSVCRILFTINSESLPKRISISTQYMIVSSEGFTVLMTYLNKINCSSKRMAKQNFLSLNLKIRL